MWALQNSATKCLITEVFSQPVTLSLAGAAASKIFIATNTRLSRQKTCFVATNIILSRQDFYRDKLAFVATNTCLSRQNPCHDKSFAATKIFWQLPPILHWVFKLMSNNFFVNYCFQGPVDEPNTGVALISKFCVNITFSGAIRILAASPRHRTLNDCTWTPI